MMKIKIGLCICFIILLSGCWNYRELNDLAITIGVGLDKVGDNYVITAQTVNAKKSNTDSTNSSTPKIITYTAAGETIQEAFRKLLLVSPKRTYANHVQILIFGENITKEGLHDSFDIFFRDPESRKNYLTLIAKGTTAEKVLKVLTPIEEISATHIYESLIADSEFYGISEKITYERLMELYLNNKMEISLPTVSIVGSENHGEKLDNIEDSAPETKIILSETGVFEDDKLLGYLNSEESIYLSIIKNVLKNTIITYECDKDKYMSLEIVGLKTKLNTKNNSLDIDINVKSEANITEIYCNVDLTKDSVIEELESSVNKKIEDNIIKTINSIINKYNSDVFGFEDLFYRNNLKFYNSIKDEWDSKYLKELKFNVKVDITLLSKGNILEVIKNEK